MPELRVQKQTVLLCWLPLPGKAGRTRSRIWADKAWVENLLEYNNAQGMSRQYPRQETARASPHLRTSDGNYSSDRETVYKPDQLIIEDATT